MKNLQMPNKCKPKSQVQTKKYIKHFHIYPAVVIFLQIQITRVC